MTVRFGLIGCGRVAPRHAQSLIQLPETQLVSVADIREDRARRFSAEYGAQAYTDYHDMLARPDIDAVTVCVPSGLHAQVAIDVLQAGKHVLVEKPIALNLADADRMIATAREAGLRLGVVLQNRYNSPVQQVRTLIDQGRLGKLYLGSVCVRWYRPQSYYEDGWHGTLSMDGGALMNQSIHHLDALQWFMGPVASVYAYTATLAHTMESEDVGVAVVRFRSGALATIEGSTLTWPQNLEGSVAVFGEHGSVKVGGTALSRITLWKVDGELEREAEILTGQRVDPPTVYGYSHREVIHDFARALLDGREPSTPGPEARKSLALVLAIYESARTGREVQLPHE
ncbi:MAG: Gfo/Idh/MocA family oxidoreductase [Anaerolineae bacterium]|jgi:predicted dehydrogenase|nr:Gfo/Idh/MocA family oxidoreductase [Anaerolineae bacterium]MDX9830957.1 Gfo/Idh/MocA family oxidoreductase [Anaerolineae bacterium]